jgi:hypothetical protein
MDPVSGDAGVSTLKHWHVLGRTTFDAGVCFSAVDRSDLACCNFSPTLYTHRGGNWRRSPAVFKPKWEYISSKYRPKSHVTVYRDDLLHVQMQIVTRQSNHYNSEKAKFFFFIDDDSRIFRSEEEMIGALAKKFEHQDRQRFSLITHWVKSIED